MTSKYSGVIMAMLAAALFGATTPLNKLLLGDVSPVLLAGLLYLGSGIGSTCLFVLRRARTRAGVAESPITKRDAPWLGGAIVAGAIVGALLLMFGLQRSPGSTASLLLNLEGVFTAGLAWVVFRENVDRRVLLGMLLILSGGLVLSWQGRVEAISLTGIALVIGACACWAIDNNLTQKVSASDPLQIAAIKGWVAGLFNTALGFVLGASLPNMLSVMGALLIGFLGYGLSIALFVLALRHIGTARTGAYFALAPFVGAILSVVVLREPITLSLTIAGAFMLAGVWLHLTERHGHAHHHHVIAHAHSHTHDEHHEHTHADGDSTALNAPHVHVHVHAPQTHEHPHYPDIHHRHEHAPDAESDK